MRLKLAPGRGSDNVRGRGRGGWGPGRLYSPVGVGTIVTCVMLPMSTWTG